MKLAGELASRGSGIPEGEGVRPGEATRRWIETPIMRQKTRAIANASTFFQSIGPASRNAALAFLPALDRANQGCNEGVRFWTREYAAKDFVSAELNDPAKVLSPRDCSM